MQQWGSIMNGSRSCDSAAIPVCSWKAVWLGAKHLTSLSFQPLVCFGSNFSLQQGTKFSQTHLLRRLANPGNCFGVGKEGSHRPLGIHERMP